MFADAVDAVARENGGKSGWQGAHNVYLEVASEAGIPALILYASSVILCVTLNYRCIKLCRGRPQHKNALGHATVLLLATAAFAINIFFCNVTFDAYLPMLVGLTAANMIAVKKEIQAHSDDAPAATPVMSRAPNLRPAVARS
jgi:O-antigen ligase